MVSPQNTVKHITQESTHTSTKWLLQYIMDINILHHLYMTICGVMSCNSMTYYEHPGLSQQSLYLKLLCTFCLLVVRHLMLFSTIRSVDNFELLELTKAHEHTLLSCKFNAKTFIAFDVQSQLQI